MMQLEAQLQSEYRSILHQEELLWYQKARENMVRFGNRNTTYFHTHTIIRRKRNNILRLKINDGSWCDDSQVLRREIQNYFQSLFAADLGTIGGPLEHELMPLLTEGEKQMIESPMIKEEVRQALMMLKSFSAPGPDGFHSFFFKKYW